MTSLQLYRQKIDQAATRHSILTTERESLVEKLTTSTKTLQDSEVALAFVQKVAQSTQEQLAFRIRDQADIALESLFPGKYTLGMNFEVKHGQVAVELYLLNADGNMLSCTQSVGGGVSDILAFALRLNCVLLSKAPRLVVLDEPFKNISADLQGQAGALLHMLSEQAGFQFLLSNHDRMAFPAGAKIVDCEALVHTAANVV